MKTDNSFNPIILNSVLHGQSASTNKPVIVLIHGLFGSMDNLSALRRHFEQDYQVISVDLPDHGQSPHLSQFSFEIYADAVIHTVQERTQNKIILIGHSLGGKVAMRIAQKMSSQVKALIVLDIAPVKYASRHQQVFSALNNVELTSITSRKDAQQALAQYLDEPATQSFLLKGLYQQSDSSWAWRYNVTGLHRDYALLSDWPYEDASYSGATLFVKGTESDYITKAHQSTIQSLFPRATAKLVQAGHWLHAEKPQVVNAVITNFLRVNIN
ncbi:alpha/beta fold hydrolase [Agaribacter flavus]|uniref:Alpha/beta fold hydrolase n=1 Tax=Agaribacter flavus TaxID=1902781 RepID=A0ABV7FPR6_9ALTE